MKRRIRRKAKGSHRWQTAVCAATPGGRTGLAPTKNRSLRFETLEDRLFLAVQPFPVPLSPLAPVGSVIYQANAAATIDTPEEIESFTVDLDDGQTIAVAVDPASALDVAIAIRNPSGSVLATASTSGVGLDELVRAVATTGAGTYTVDVSAVDGTTGNFSINLFLNADIEAETHGGATNDTAATAQHLDDSFVELGIAAASRGAVVGKLPSAAGGVTINSEAPDTGDWYLFSLNDGQSASIALAAVGGPIFVDLFDATGTVKLTSGHNAVNWSQVIENFVDTTSDGAPTDYHLQVRGANLDYELSVIRDAAFDLEPNDSLGEAQDIGGVNQVLGHAGVGDDDWYSIAVNNGDLLTIGVSSPGAGPFEFVNPLGAGSPGGIIISEVVHGTLADGNPRFVEITNTGATPYTFLAGGLIVQSDSSVDRVVDIDLTGLTILPGQSFVIAATANDGQATFEATYGFAADLYTDAFLGDGNDRYLLTDTSDGGHVLDIFGEIDTDGVGRPWEYTDSYAVRGALAITPTGSTFNSGDWIFGGVNALVTGDDVTEAVLLQTLTTPGVHASVLEGQPLVRVELYDPTGNLLDSGFAGLEHAAGPPGVYHVRVVALEASGEYMLAVNGASGLNDSPYVVATDPEDGAPLNQFPVSYIVTLSEPLLETTVEAADLLINGQPGATAVTQLDLLTYEFHMSPVANLGNGTYTIELPAGAFHDLSGRPSEAFTATFTYDVTGPLVLDVLFNGAALPIGGNLPAGGLVVDVFFSEDLREEIAAGQLGAEDALLTNNVTGEVLGPSILTYDAALNMASLTFVGLDESVYTLTLLSADGAFEDLAGNNLDGEPSGPSSVGTPSGNGTPGGNYVVIFQTDNVGARNVEPFERLRPLGSFMAASKDNFGVIGSLDDVDEFQVYVQAGQILSAVITPDQSNATVFLSLVEISGAASSAAPGQPAALATELMPFSGLVTLRIVGDITTTYHLDVYAGAAHEFTVGDSADGNELPLDNTFLELGSGRWGAIGETSANPSLSTIFTQDFNLNVGGFVFNNTTSGSGNGLWHLSTGRQSDGDPNHSPAGSLYFGQSEGPLGNGNYNTGTATGGTATSPTIALPSAEVVLLSLNHFLATDGVLGRDVAEIAVDAGSGFVTVASTVDGSLTPNTGGLWAPLSIDLSQYAGQTVRVQFRFDSIDAVQNQFEGWYIDDVRIQAADSYLADLDEYTIDLTSYVGRPIDIVVAGQLGASLAGADVELLGPDGTTVLATASPIPLGAAATNFDQGILAYVPPAPGVYTLRVISDQPGQYGVLLTESLPFEVESNDSVGGSLRPISIHPALGYLGGPSQETSGGSATQQFAAVPPGFATDLSAGSSLPANSIESDDEYGATPIAAFTAFLPIGVSLEELASQLSAYNDTSPADSDGAFAFGQASGITALIGVSESEPNNSTATANSVPLGFGAGQDVAIDVTGSSGTGDIDYFRLSLSAGDIVGVNVAGAATSLSLLNVANQLIIGSTQNITYIQPASSPLPGGGNAALSAVIPVTGDYYVGVSGNTGDYNLNLRLFRPILESELYGTRQKLYLDFNGATLDASIFGGSGNRTLSGLSSSLAGWGLTAADESAVIDAIVATVEENLSADVRALGNNGDFLATGIHGQFDIEILNSRDDADPFGLANVSRIIIGGTQSQLGINTIGIAETIDVGNFDTTESAVVLLDLLSAASNNLNSLNRFVRAPSASIIDLIGVAVGNIVSHEAGHFFASWHTNPNNAMPSIMDQGGNLAGMIGLNGSIWGDGDEIDLDFGPDTFVSDEGFTGTQDSLNSIAFGLSTGRLDTGLVGPRVLSVNPHPGIGLDVGVATIDVEFSESISASSANDASNYQLIEAGANGLLENGTGDDVTFTLSPVFDGDWNVELIVGDGNTLLGFGKYQLTVDGDNSIEDLDGNPLNSTTGPGGGADFTHEFQVEFSVPPGGDFYRLDLEFGQRATLETRTPWNDPLGSLTNDLDTQLIIYDSFGTPLVIDGDSGEGNNARASFIASVGGPYFVQVIADAGAGEYLLDSSIEEVVLLGDYNRDGSVSSADYTTWRNTLGTHATPYHTADGDGDGIVGLDDFQVWKSNYGTTFETATEDQLIVLEQSAGAGLTETLLATDSYTSLSDSISLSPDEIAVELTVSSATAQTETSPLVMSVQGLPDLDNRTAFHVPFSKRADRSRPVSTLATQNDLLLWERPDRFDAYQFAKNELSNVTTRFVRDRLDDSDVPNVAAVDEFFSHVGGSLNLDRRN